MLQQPLDAITSRVGDSARVYIMNMATYIASVLQATGPLTVNRKRVRKCHVDIQLSECSNGIAIVYKDNFLKLFD